MAVYAIDFGGSHIRCGVVAGRSVLAEDVIPSDALSLRESLKEVRPLLRGCRERSGVSGAVLRGIAVGFCGIVDSATGEVLSTLDKYKDAAEIDVEGWARREFDLPLRVENDACLALLGEVYAGAGRGARDVVMVTLGTGIGGAAMLGGKLLRSHAGQAGCLGGHLPVNFRGRRCSCGAVGCAEAEASTWVLPLLCQEHAGFGQSTLAAEARIDFAAVFAASAAGDRVACDVLKHCTDVWAALTVGLIHAYGPELVIFGGGVMNGGDAVLAPIRAYVQEHTWKTSRGLPRIVAAELGPGAALLGGAALFGEAAAADCEEVDAV